MLRTIVIMMVVIIPTQPLPGVIQAYFKTAPWFVVMRSELFGRFPPLPLELLSVAVQNGCSTLIQMKTDQKEIKFFFSFFFCPNSCLSEGNKLSESGKDMTHSFIYTPLCRCAIATDRTFSTDSF